METRILANSATSRVWPPPRNSGNAPREQDLIVPVRAHCYPRSRGRTISRGYAMRFIISVVTAAGLLLAVGLLGAQQKDKDKDKDQADTRPKESEYKKK